MPTLKLYLLHTLILTSLFLVICTAALADSQFITDRIYLDVYEQPKNKGVVVFAVLSGTIIDVLKVDGEYSQVKNRENKIGWINSKYISKDKPSQIAFVQLRKRYDASLVKIRELQSKNSISRDSSKVLDALNKAKKELSKVAQEKAELENSLNERTDSLNKSIGTINVLTEQLSRFKDSNSNLQINATGEKTPLLKDFTLPVTWTIAALVLCLIIGITIGIKWLEHKITKRHGGVKIF